MKSADWLTAAGLLSKGAVGIIPTDTLYGFSALVSQSKAIDRIYHTKGRSPGNPLVILAASIDQIAATFPVIITNDYHEAVIRYNDYPTSIIYQLDKDHCGDWKLQGSDRDDIAIRIPHSQPRLLGLLESVGPIVSTSANRHGQKPKTSPKEIKQEFGQEVDFIVEMGKKTGPASRIIKINPNGEVKILRDK